MFFLHSFNRSNILSKLVLRLIPRWGLWMRCSWFICRRDTKIDSELGLIIPSQNFFVVFPSLLRQIAVILTWTRDPGQTYFQSVLSYVGMRDHKNNFLGWLVYLNTMKSWTAGLDFTTLCSDVLMCSVLASSCLLQGRVSHLYQDLKWLILKNIAFVLHRVRLRETVCETKGCKQHCVIKY